MRTYAHRLLVRLTASVVALFVVSAVTASSALAGVPSSIRGVFPGRAAGMDALAIGLYAVAGLGLFAVIVAWSVISSRRDRRLEAAAPIVKLRDDSSAARKAA
jgi:hypothetical protein